jgi:phosphoribosyl-ATP pyrophosphohydrolase/phosphoribosyl-AMP cyclohydrolase
MTAVLHDGTPLDELDFAKGGGTVTVVAQDARTGVVLMVAHADRDALERSLSTGEMHYLSRTRGPWRKGAVSGNVQRVIALARDCDGDSVLALVVQQGNACHTGSATCFAGSVPFSQWATLATLDGVIAARSLEDGEEQSYTRRLLADRNLRLKKLGEEAAEFAVALADGDPDRSVEEAADLVYHMLVALRAVGRGLAHIEAELGGRGNRDRPDNPAPVVAPDDGFV